MQIYYDTVGVGSHAAAFGPSAALTVHRTVIHSRFAAKATLDDPLFSQKNFLLFYKKHCVYTKKNIKINFVQTFFRVVVGADPYNFHT